MISKKQALILIVGGLLLASFIILKRKSIQQLEDGIFTVGILQTASHPALDAVKEGFIQELKQKLPKSVQFVERNAQGNISSAHAIAQSFAHDKSIDAFFAIATPALQALAAVEKQKPIFFAAVTEPRLLGVVHPTTNVAGASDMTNIPDTVVMVQGLLPDAKTVALLYNNGEINSTTAASSMRKEFEKKGYSVIDVSVAHESDMLAAVQSATAKADVIVAPTDNTVASTIDLIVQKTLEAKKPLIVSDNLLVGKGALAARGIDYKMNGKQAAQLASFVLNTGKKPFELAIGYATSGRIFVNQQTLEKLGLTIPQSLEESVTIIKK